VISVAEVAVQRWSTLSCAAGAQPLILILEVMPVSFNSCRTTGEGFSVKARPPSRGGFEAT